MPPCFCLGALVKIWPPAQPKRAASAAAAPGRSLGQLLRQPKFAVAVMGAALGYGVMNLLMAATPLAMQVCGYEFSDAALVLQWHVIGMFAPGFVTGHLIQRFGVLTIMGVGVLLNLACVLVALSGQDLHQFTIALALLGVGWNFLFTGSTTLAMQAYRPEEKDRAQASINFFVFATMAITSFASGALVTTQGWELLNYGSLLPIAITGAALLWLALLFGTALYAERHAGVFARHWRPVYALSLAVHCTSWTFYGTVTQAARYGWPLPPTFLGAILFYGLAVGFMIRLVRLARETNATSLADLIATRLGKDAWLAATVTLVAALGLSLLRQPPRD